MDGSKGPKNFKEWWHTMRFTQKEKLALILGFLGLLCFTLGVCLQNLIILSFSMMCTAVAALKFTYSWKDMRKARLQREKEYRAFKDPK